MSDSNTESESIVRGVVKRVTFRNPSNGYAVLQISIAEKDESLTVVGTTPDAQVGSNILVRGTFIKHPKFGKQLNARSITEIAPDTEDGIEKYLGSGLIKGIGPQTAKRIVKTFGTTALETIYRDPVKLAKVKGVGKHKAQLIIEALRGQEELREIMRFLVEHNISTNLATRIFERYQNRAVEVLQKDPYLLAREMRGVGFLTADTIAMNLGLKLDAPQRLKAGIYYSLEQASDDGHCFLAEAVLAQRARALLQVPDDFDLEPHLNALISEGFLKRDAESIYLKHLYKAEEFVAAFIASRVTHSKENKIPSAVVERALEKAEKELGVKFSAEQELAVDFATREPLLIITGGPGCGKTTVIRALTSVFKAAQKRILMAAPTGRAAQRMSQVTGLPASTIHRLLKYDPHTRGFLHGPNQPLACDVLIIDEASMIDLLLAKDLFGAIPAECTLILVGDKDQLPSVGPGRVFGDLISLKEIHTVSLSKLFRRSTESSINTIAHMVNSGVVPEIPQPDGNTKTDAYFIPKSELEDAAQVVENLVADQLPKKFGFELSEIIVLTPSNRGPLGTIELNKRLQSRLNPKEDGLRDQEIALGDTFFRLGDRVCQRVNNYNLHEAGVFNGDAGHIYSIDARKRELVVELWDGRLIKYQHSDLPQLSLAYALSVHRSQGSEIPCVVMVLHESHYTLLERQLLYTGLTRAKKLLVIVGTKKALSIATRRTESKRRCTDLPRRIKERIDR